MHEWIPTLVKDQLLYLIKSGSFAAIHVSMHTLSTDKHWYVSVTLQRNARSGLP